MVWPWHRRRGEGGWRGSGSEAVEMKIVARRGGGNSQGYWHTNRCVAKPGVDTFAGWSIYVDMYLRRRRFNGVVVGLLGCWLLDVHHV